MILDTDVLIDLKRKHPHALAWLSMLPAPPLVCGIAAMELLHGSWDKREQEVVNRFLKPFPLSWPTEPDLVRACVEYVRPGLDPDRGWLKRQPQRAWQRDCVFRCDALR